MPVSASPWDEEDDGDDEDEDEDEEDETDEVGGEIRRYEDE